MGYGCRSCGEWTSNVDLLSRPRANKMVNKRRQLEGRTAENVRSSRSLACAWYAAGALQNLVIRARDYRRLWHFEMKQEIFFPNGFLLLRPWSGQDSRSTDPPPTDSFAPVPPGCSIGCDYLTSLPAITALNPLFIIMTTSIEGVRCNPLKTGLS